MGWDILFVGGACFWGLGVWRRCRAVGVWLVGLVSLRGFGFLRVGKGNCFLYARCIFVVILFIFFWAVGACLNTHCMGSFW